MLKKIGVVCSLLAAVWSSSALALDFPLGQWSGWMKFDGQQSKFAVKLDTLKYQPNDPNEFPRFQMLFRVGLGGFLSPEYFSQYYGTVNYDFDHGNVTLDTAENDLVMALKVEHVGSFVVLRGSVFSRSTAVSGNLVMKYLTDEPDDGGSPGDDPTIDPAPFASPLTGQYEGKCGNDDAVFQIETARGLGDELPDARFPGLKGYKFNARLGFDDAALCSTDGIARPGVRNWCTVRSYSSGEFNIANGSLLLGGSGGTPECVLRDGLLQCNVRVTENPVACSLRQVGPQQPSDFHPFPRLFSVASTADQRRDLPPPSPPSSSALLQALNGMYAGFLHHESTDRYQPVRLNVLASVSTENPHNPNMVYISGATVLHFNEPTALQPLIWSQRFERKAFYVRAGFTLDDHSSDSFIQIDAWKQGLITGTLYSRQFGRVGTIQLVKGSMPALDSRAKTIVSPIGTFSGPIVSSPNTNRFWLFQTVAETQATEAGKSTLSFRGEVGTPSGLIIRKSIVQGSYDFLSQSIAFATEEEGGDLHIYTGHLFDWGMGLYWPGAPFFGIIISSSHAELRYLRQP